VRFSYFVIMQAARRGTAAGKNATENEILSLSFTIV
jgi:hypothetical protein